MPTLDINLTLSTSTITEGTNLYYTQARFNSAFSAKSTSDLTEGTNLYYTQTRFNTAFSSKSTSDLTEGTNLYYTDARARAAITGTTNRVDVTSGVVDISASYVGQNTITTLGTIATGTWNGTAIASGYGGTGFSTYAAGDLIYASALNTLSKLTAGTNGHVLTLAGGLPTWAAIGGTISGLTAGRVTYAASATTLTDSANFTFSGTALNLGAATASGRVLDVKQGSATWNIGEWSGNTGWVGMYANQTSTSGYTGLIIGATANQTYLNSGANGLNLTIAGNLKLEILNTVINTPSSLPVSIGSITPSSTMLTIKGTGTSSSTFASKLFQSDGTTLTHSFDDAGNAYHKAGINIGGGVQLKYLAVTSTYAILTTDYTIDCTTGTFTVTLPTAVGNTRVYNIKNSGTGDITIATTSSQTIDGQASGYWVLAGSSKSCMTVQSNGANWIII